MRRIAFVLCSLMIVATAATAQVGVVSNQTGSSVSILDLHTMHVTATIPVGIGPHEVELSPDGRVAYVANYGDREHPGSAISVIDLASATELRRIDVGLKRPHGLAARGTKLLFTAEGSQSVGELDVASGTVTWSKKLERRGTHMLAVTRDARRIYAVDIPDNRVSVIDRAHDVVTEVMVGGGPEGIAMSPDEREVWVGNRGGGGISIIDTRKNAVVATIASEVSGGRLRFTPNGRHVLVSDLKGETLLIVDAKSRKSLGTIDVGGVPVTCVVSPDSKRAFVTVLPSDEVVEVDLVTRKATRRVKAGPTADGLAVRFR